MVQQASYYYEIKSDKEVQDLDVDLSVNLKTMANQIRVLKRSLKSMILDPLLVDMTVGSFN